ncbi:MAG: hypothetical protein KDC83_15535 [Flavobacteriales bacterium]|nr:hypothetical protein [Flavobacteriales bacterium]
MMKDENTSKKSDSSVESQTMRFSGVHPGIQEDSPISILPPMPWKARNENLADKKVKLGEALVAWNILLLPELVTNLVTNLENAGFEVDEECKDELHKLILNGMQIREEYVDLDSINYLGFRLITSLKKLNKPALTKNDMNEILADIKSLYPYF